MVLHKLTILGTDLAKIKFTRVGTTVNIYAWREQKYEGKSTDDESYETGLHGIPWAQY